MNNNWKPENCEEVERISRAVREGLTEPLGNQILRSGLSRLPNEERMKYFTRILYEFFAEFSEISLDETGHFKQLLNCTDSEKPENVKLFIHLRDELTRINNNRDLIEKSMDKIKTLLKKLKKIK